jgi:hypothetical protein
MAVRPKGKTKSRDRIDSVQRLGDLIEQSSDPEVILAQMRRDFGDIGLSSSPRAKVGRRREERKFVSVDTMTDDTEYVVEKSVSKWIFGESPEVRKVTPELGVSESETFELPEIGSFSGKSLDDGSFRGDPVLKVLRARLRSACGDE